MRLAALALVLAPSARVVARAPTHPLDDLSSREYRALDLREVTDRQCFFDRNPAIDLQR